MSILFPYINAGSFSVCRTSCAAIHVFSAAFCAASCCCNLGFSSITYVRPLSHLSLLAFVIFVFFTLRCHLFFILQCHLFSFINSCAFSYCFSFFFSDESSRRNVVNSSVYSSTVCRSLNYYTSILFVQHKCWKFSCVAHFGAAILVFSARFGAAFCCCNFAFFPTTYVRSLSHLSFLAFVPFLFFTLRCHLFFILLCHLSIFISSCAFSYCLSFFLPDEASGRNVGNSTVCCSTVCCSLKHYTCTSILFVLHRCRNFFCVAHFRAAILVFATRFGAASCCCHFNFCSTTYDRPLSPLSLLAFVHFVLFTLRCHLLFILPCHLFFFINLCAFSTVFPFSYLMKPLGELSLILLSVVLPSIAL